MEEKKEREKRKMEKKLTVIEKEKLRKMDEEEKLREMEEEEEEN